MRMECDDSALAIAAAGGDRAAFSALLERHYDRLFALCFRLTGRRAEAEDLTQDICLALPAKLGGWRGEARFTTWLYRIAVNAAHDRRRRAATQSRHADGWGDWELARQAAMAEEREALDWLTEAMRALPAELRDTAALILDGQLSQAEAAEILGVAEGTVAWRMSDVKKRLKALKAKEDMA